MALRPEEARAAETLAVMLDGTVVPRDVLGAPEGSHDFDVETRSGRIAVEVTRAVDGPSHATAGVRRRMDWTCPSLAESWDLSHRPSMPDVKTLHREVEALLVVLQNSNVKRFEVRELDGLTEDVRSAIVRLSDLGIRRGTAIGRVGETATILFGSSTVGSPGPGLVNSVVEAKAEAKATKLARATASERHLFVWIESSADQANAAMGFDVLPSTAPTLPEVVDVAWVAPAPYDNRGVRLTGRLWRATADGWQDIGTVRRENLESDSASIRA